jgi:hypothetical protein
MIVGAVIVVLPTLSLIPSSKETKLYDQVVSTLFTTTDARDVSNPPAGLQDQHAALNRHRDRAAPGKYKHTIPSHALRQNATLTGDKADCSDTLLREHSPCRRLGQSLYQVGTPGTRSNLRSLQELIGIEKVWSVALSGRACNGCELTRLTPS